MAICASRFLRLVPVVGLALLLTACGGGGTERPGGSADAGDATGGGADATTDGSGPLDGAGPDTGGFDAAPDVAASPDSGDPRDAGDPPPDVAVDVGTEDAAIAEDVPEPIDVPPVQCDGDEACDDGRPCTVDRCGADGWCTYETVAGSCNDGNPCTLGDQCEAGECVGTLRGCDDLDPCTENECVPEEGGCVARPLTGTPCDDLDACTVADTCVDGICLPGVPADCDDEDPCTEDTCSGGACRHRTVDGAACTPAGLCFAAGVCDDGACVGTDPLDCDDDNPCTTDTCLPSQGCYHSNNASACDDGDACTVDDRCAGGACVAGEPLDCDDGEQCTEDACFGGECGHRPLFEGGCDDGDPCTAGDACQAGACVGGPAPDCDDGNPCTDDSCLAGQGCVHAANQADCDDGDACTADDHCRDGDCQPGRDLCGPGDCEPIGVLTCDASAAFDAATQATTDEFDAWTCAAGGEAFGGGEITWRLPVPTDGLVQVVLEDAPDGVTVVLLEEDPREGGCRAASCIGSGPAPVFQALVGDGLFVVVDAPEGVVARGTLRVLCGGSVVEVCDDGDDEDGDGLVDCDDPDCAGQGDCPALVEECTNQVDDDADGATDCDDSDCATDETCAPDCAPIATIDCGGTVADDGFSGFPFEAGWPCAEGGAALVAPELVYRVTVDERTQLDLDLGLLGANQHLIVLADEACAPESCVAAGVGALSVVVDAGSWTIVVDSPSEVLGAVSLAVECRAPAETCDDGGDDDGDGLADCDDPDCAGAPECRPADVCTPVPGPTCGGSVSSFVGTPAGSSALSAYPCLPFDVFDGPEVVYRLTLDTSALVDLRLETDGTDLRLIAFPEEPGGCTAGSCVVDTAGEVSLPIAAGEPWLVVVDGALTGFGAPFTLHAACEASEADCGDGVDDDGDGSTDCEDGDCFGVGDCGVTCQSEGTLSCGEVVQGVIGEAGGTSRVMEYTCPDGTLSRPGPERAWLLDVPEGREARFEWLDGSAPVLLFVVESADGSCDPAQCVAADTGEGGPTAAAFRPVPGLTYHAVIDAEAPGAAGTFELQLVCDTSGELDCTDGVDDDDDGATDCDDGDCLYAPECAPPGCADAVTVGCGEGVAGDTTQGVAFVAEYGCAGAPLGDGETAFRVVPDIDGTLQLTLTADGGAPEVLLLGADDAGGCRAADCLARGSATVEAPITAGAALYVVVDAAAGEGGPFTLQVDCLSDAVTERVCDDGADDDGDGAVDCLDTDCQSAPSCPAPVLETACAGGADDDGDGYADCDDPDCRGVGACAVEVACVDGLDQDGDGFTDCDDLDCSFAPACGLDGCIPDVPIGCDERLSIARGGFGATDRIAAWACPQPVSGQDGPERTLFFMPWRSGTATIRLLSGVGLTTMVVPDAGAGCAAAACAASGPVVSFPVVAGEVFHLVVDGPESAADVFTIEVDCTP